MRTYTHLHAHVHTQTHTLGTDPLLVYEKAQLGEEGFERAIDLFPAGFNPNKLQPEFSGKMLVLDYLLAVTRSTTDDKVHIQKVMMESFLLVHTRYGYNFSFLLI